MSKARLSACMLIYHKGHTDTIQVHSVTVMTHVKALQAGHSSQGTSEPITPGRERIRPHLSRNCPWWKILLQAGRLDLPRHIMGSPNVVHTVLRRALPHSVPRHWAPPQLGQVQVISRHVPIHITLDEDATKRTTRWTTLPVPRLSRCAHLVQLPLMQPHVVNDRRRPLLD